MAKITFQLSKMRKGSPPISEEKMLVPFGDYRMYSLGSKNLRALLFGVDIS